MSNEPVDVLIVGAGASGAAFAWSLLGSRMRILCLEQGPLITDAAFPSRNPDYELGRYGDFSCDPNVRRLPQDYPVNSDDSPITPVNFCAVGGSTINYLAYWPALLRAGVELRPDCRVREITLDENGMASGVLYHDPEGRLQRQRAEVVVLACSGVGTPRLMLNSTSNRFPEGIANRSGLVGRNLMFHPLTGVAGVFDEPMDGFKGPMACSIFSQEFYETDPSRDFVRGYGLHSGRSTTPMTWALGGFGIDAPIPWGAEHRRLMDEVYPYLAGLTVVTEDLPRETNTVTLDPVLTDGDGIPAPKITYAVDDNTKRMISHGEARAEEALLAAGAKQVVGAGEKVWWRAGWHQMGTARMGDDPERSVVNGWGRCHDVRNLFIVDGSVFVTAGAVNPTSTIQALALYIGDSILKNAANLFD